MKKNISLHRNEKGEIAWKFGKNRKSRHEVAVGREKGEFLNEDVLKI